MFIHLSIHFYPEKYSVRFLKLLLFFSQPFYDNSFPPQTTNKVTVCASCRYSQIKRASVISNYKNTLRRILFLIQLQITFTLHSKGTPPQLRLLEAPGGRGWGGYLLSFPTWHSHSALRTLRSRLVRRRRGTFANAGLVPAVLQHCPLLCTANLLELPGDEHTPSSPHPSTWRT